MPHNYIYNNFADHHWHCSEITVLKKNIPGTGDLKTLEHLDPTFVLVN